MKKFEFRGKKYSWNLKKGTVYPYLCMAACFVSTAIVCGLVAFYAGAFPA